MSKPKPVDRNVLVRIHEEHHGKDWRSITKHYNIETNDNKTSSGLRSHYARNKEYFKTFDEPVSFNEMTDKIIDEPMEPWTEDRLLELLNLDKREFQLRTNNTGLINKWFMDAEGNEDELSKRIRNGQVKIFFEKRKYELNEETLMSAFSKLDIEPRVIEQKDMTGKGLLKISLNDVHLWNNSADDYKDHIDEIVMNIRSRHWEQILIKQGGDFFHANNSNGTTVAGTQVAHEMSKEVVFDWGAEIMSPIIEESLKHANKVKYVYIEGNHDKDLAWSFAWGLSKIYPQVEFDLAEQVYKQHKYHDVLLFMVHGDKPRNSNRLGKTLFALYRKDIAKAETVEVHMEHIHHEKIKDEMGMVFQTNPTANNIDKYHLEGGFVGSRKIFQCYVYNTRARKNTINIDGDM